MLLVVGLGILVAVVAPQIPRAPIAANNATIKPTAQIDPATIPPSIRTNYADTLERNYLDKGMDVHVDVSGKKKDTIRLQYIMFTRPAVYKIQKNGKLLEEMRQLGFRKVIFADGYDTSWTFDLTK